MAGDESVTIGLTADEAIVLFEWLSGFNKRDDVTFDDQAEQRVLWDIEATLETRLAAPFQDDYDAVVARARARLRDPDD